MVHGRADFTGEGLRPGLIGLMNPYVNEALFADFVVLVEGDEDKAILEAALERHADWPVVATRAIAVVPVRGKTNLDKLAAILSRLGVPFFLVFDRDGEQRDEEQARRWNLALQALAGVAHPDGMPPTSVGSNHAVFAPELTVVLREEMGAAAWQSLHTQVCEDLGIEMRGQLKNAEVLRIMLERASATGMSSPSVDAAVTGIVGAVRRALIPPTRERTPGDSDVKGQHDLNAGGHED
jgi:hypothetical protein